VSNRIQSLEELEALYAKPQETSLGKECDEINPYYRRLIEAAPFFAIASSGPRGLDVSPRGDAAGFVEVLDKRTIAIPDRRGNNRIDTLRNILDHPAVALLFLILGLNMTLRYNGQAHISTEAALLDTMCVAGKPPVCAIVVELETLFFQCARALKRAELWNPERYVDPSTLPSTGELARSAMPSFDAENYDADLEERQSRTLY